MRKTERVLLDAKKVYDLAEKKGVLKSELSEACGMSDAWIYGAIRKPIIRPKAELLSDYLGVSLDEIMVRDEPKENGFPPDDVSETAQAIAEMTKAIKHMEQEPVIELLSDIYGAILAVQTLQAQTRKDILEAIESVWGLEE